MSPRTLSPSLTRVAFDELWRDAPTPTSAHIEPLSESLLATSRRCIDEARANAALYRLEFFSLAASNDNDHDDGSSSLRQRLFDGEVLDDATLATAIMRGVICGSDSTRLSPLIVDRLLESDWRAYRARLDGVAE